MEVVTGELMRFFIQFEIVYVVVWCNVWLMVAIMKILSSGFAGTS